MDPYNTILNDRSIYPSEMIERFAKKQKSWNIMSPRNKEHLCRHILCCVLLCNMEKEEENMEIIDQSDTAQKKRKESGFLPHEKDAKRSRAEANKDETVSEAAVSTATSSGGSLTEDRIDLETALESSRRNSDYRFSVIKYMPAPQMEMRRYSNAWNTRCPSSIWDMVDRKYKSFLNLYIGVSFEAAQRAYVEVRMDNFGHCSSIWINPQTLEHSSIDLQEAPLGLSKVLSFLQKRRNLCNNLGILETKIQESSCLINTVLCSKFINEAVAVWENDHLATLEEKWSPNELYNDETESSMLKTITPKKLLQNLHTLDEDNRMGFITWRGKISPEGWVHNLNSSSPDDFSMVEEFFNFLTVEMVNVKRSTINYRVSEYDGILEEILDHWKMTPDLNSFNFAKPKGNSLPITKRALGIGMKGRSFDPNICDAKQKVHKALEPLRYNSWFDEVVRRLNQESPSLPLIPFKNLLLTPETEHPIAKLSEEACTALTSEILKSNAAVYSQKNTNLYSRLGGAYAQGIIETNRERSSIAVFPLYAMVSDPENLISCTRLLHGVCIRGPSHLKSPTDRLAFLTIEAFKKNMENREFIANMNRAIIYETPNFFIVTRQNSIMKEDTSYCTFTINALFCPLNTLGCMTLENPHLRQYENMDTMLKKTIGSHSLWFQERFTEGLLFAVVGNSRDEGYFSMLRKLFMVILQIRQDQPSATWEIESMCEKTNECLLDNPLSMYFHRQLLKVLRIYKNRLSSE